MCDLTIHQFYSLVWFCIQLTTIVGASNNGMGPVVLEHPSDVIVSKGEPATLTCKANSKDVTVSWFKDGHYVRTNKDDSQSHRLILANGELFFLRVNGGKNESDAGLYYCVVQNKYGSARSNEASLKIALLLDNFKTNPRPVQAILGKSAVLECSPPHGFPPPVVTWRKNEQEFLVPTDGRVSLNPPGNLVFSEVDRKDAGLYQCVATNMVGERMSNPVKLSVYEKPYFTTQPKGVSVEVGHTAKFDCGASGDPMPSISWKKRDSPMPVGRAYISKGSDGLTIEKVEITDEGEYICIAKNQAGDVEASAKLEVFEQPHFLVRPTEVSVEKGGTAVFNCKVKGHPSPALFWTREGQNELYFPGRGTADGHIRILNDAQLVIKNVDTSDAGFYTCSTLNTHGSNLAKAALKIVSKTLVKNPPPLIVYGHANQTLAVGTPAFLPCSAKGFSTAPNITWFKDDRIFVSNNSDSRSGPNNMITNGSLMFNKLSMSDAGIYTCRAENVDGQTTWTASLVVKDDQSHGISPIRMSDSATLPSAPGKPQIGNTSENTVCLEWSVPETAGASLISGYMMQYYSPEQGQIWYNLNDYISDTYFCVRNLKPSQSYVFVVRAENSRGLGPPSEMSNMAYTSSVRTDLGSDMLNSDYSFKSSRLSLSSTQIVKLTKVRAVSSTSVELTWKTMKMENLIDGYYIQWRLPGSPDIESTDVRPGTAQKTILKGLKPFTNYEFFVTPYQGDQQGRPSNSMEGKTKEAAPSQPPPEVRVRMLNLTTLRISWQKPPKSSLNGICIGFQVSIEGGELLYSREIPTNERAASVTMYNLKPNTSYTVKVAARTNGGIGAYKKVGPIVMNEQTLQEHILLMHSASGASGFLQIFEKPWFIPVAAVFIWLILVAIIVFIYWKWRNLRGNSNRGAPFIKISDGSVHMNALDGMWMDHPNFNSAQRSLLLSGAGPNGNCGAPPVYTQTPHNANYYIDGQMGHNDYPINLFNTINRAQSPNHYHYASLAGNPTAPSFCVGGNQIMDDPSPYATTTLVMNNRRKWMQDSTMKPPVLPSNPVPSGPPPRYLLNSDCNTMNGRQSVSLRTHTLAESRSQGFVRAESPPHTDVSYVQSSDGTGGSSNGRAKIATLGNGRRTPPKQTLMDFLPPPPSEAPPADNIAEMETSSTNPVSSIFTMFS